MPSLPRRSPSPISTDVPFGRTARRVEWAHLPPTVRGEIERRVGAPVVSAVSQGTGFTPGFASVLTDADGRRHFVKAAALTAQRPFAEAYREEARKLGGLPTDVGAPRLLWTTEAGGWLLLATDHVEARPPHRPWRPTELDAALDLLERHADLLTPAPASLGELPAFADDLAEVAGLWDGVLAARPDLPHGAEAAGLAARLSEATAGDTVVHADVRDDNLLVRPDGTMLLCDWNFPAVGAAWIDTVTVLINARGDGLDVDTLVDSRPLTRDVPPDHVDVLLAALVGLFWARAALPVPSSSPHLRDFQRWEGDVCWAWLGERRGWV